MEEKVQNKLRELGINQAFSQSEDNTFVADLNNYEEFGDIYIRLENKAKEDKNLYQLDDSSIMNIHTADISYCYDFDDDTSFEINLIGDLDGENYKIVINYFK